jgi:hypothetical protein
MDRDDITLAYFNDAISRTKGTLRRKMSKENYDVMRIFMIKIK